MNTNSGSNGSSRPVAAQRAASENNAPHHRGGQSDVENLRAELERTWSTSNINPPSENGSANAAQHSFAQSWSTGFGEATSPWPTASFIGGSRRGSTGTPNSSNAGNRLPPPHRAASDGAPSSRPTAGQSKLPRVSSAMHDAARLKDWQKVLDISRRDPDSASYIGPGSMTALHHICDKRCPLEEVAAAVIRACPEALTAESSNGWTPLHYAGRFKCVEGVVKALLTIYPHKGKETVSKPDRSRRTPLFYAVRYDAPVGVVPQLLRADPSVVLSGDQNLQSPLEVIWDDFAEKIEGRRQLHPFIGEPENNPASPEELLELLHTAPHEELLKNWNTANIFLKAAFGFPLSEEEERLDTSGRRWRILHATAAVNCHLTLFQMACVLYPDQAQEMDENDLHGVVDQITGKNSSKQRQTALHLAAASKAPGAKGQTVISTLVKLYPEAATFADEIDGSYPLHRIADNQHKQEWSVDGIQTVYEANPAAAQTTDRNGRLPLHRAAAAVVHKDDVSTDESIVCNLLQRHPAGASVRDVDGCQPMHLLAMHGTDWDEEVQAVYAAHEAVVTVRTGRPMHNSLPIHLAAGNLDASRSFIEKLVALNPRGVSQVSGQGKLPLHLACELGKNWKEQGTELIFDAFTQAVSVREENERKWMPLHMASAADLESDCGGLIEKLVKLHPEACEIADSDGHYPLHLACKSGKNWRGGLCSLFEGNPIAIGSLDQHGRIPLYIVADEHIAASGGTTGNDTATTEGLNTTGALHVLTRQADELEDRKSVV